MILRFLFYAFLFYLGFKLLFNFILPVYRTTRKVRRSFKEMQEQMNQHAQGPQQQQQAAPAENKGKVGEYIDFEEVKD